MRKCVKCDSLAWKLAVLFLCILPCMPIAFAEEGQQSLRGPEDPEARAQARLQDVARHKDAYVSAIVRRWDDAARRSGKWGSDYRAELTGTLMKLRPESLVLASEASSFEEMMEVMATGGRLRLMLQQYPSLSQELNAVPPIVRSLTLDTMSPVNSLGSTTEDMVYTPVAPCRIVDSRIAEGALASMTPRTYDVDGTSFAAQGGVSSSCSIPSGVARAVAMNLTVTAPASTGWLSAWGIGAWTGSSSVNFNPAPGVDIANTTIVPVVPGPGDDFTVMSNVATHVVVDVVGYFGPPVATQLDCVNVQSSPVSCAYNTWTAVDATCPAGYGPTGGGYSTTETAAAFSGVWVTSAPLTNGWRAEVDNQNSDGPRSVSAWVRCCRIPGR